MFRPTFVSLCVLALAIGGCEGGGPAGNQQSDAPRTAAKGGGGRWNAADICTSFDRAAAAAAGGYAVADAKSEPMSAGGGGLAVTSMCTYTYANGATLMILAREAPDADATPGAIESARTGGGLVPPSAALPGLGKAAFWSEAGDQLQLFIDDRRYLAINFFKLPAGEDAKVKSIAVAKAFL